MKRIAVVGLASLLLIVAFAAAPYRVAAATTFTVNRIGDAADLNLANTNCDTSATSGNQCTLRAAIQEANDTPGADTINFNITSTSKTITPGSPLPPITDEVHINGYSQSGAARNTQSIGSNAVLKIVLDGLNAGAGATGLEVDGQSSIVEGLVIQRFDSSGILVTDSKIDILGNHIGTNAAGTLARGNGVGVKLTGGANCVCAGPTATSRNVISGNDTFGILVTGANAAGNQIQGNYIGTRKNGTLALANGDYGVHVDHAPSAYIGGPGNVISGNLGAGVRVDTSSGTSNSVINGNFIGTDATGAADLGNRLGGIDLSGDGMVVIGNVISGNGNDGLHMFVPERGTIEGNRIGTNAAGTAAIGNDGDGIFIHGGSDVVIGGTFASDRNLVSGNGNRGIVLFGSDGAHTIQGNYVGTKSDGTGDLGNVGAGISLSGADNSLVGGTTTGAANLSSGNGGDGIELTTQGRGNTVRGNVLRLNDGHGVEDQSGQNSILGNVIFQNGADGVNVWRSNSVGTRISANQIFGNGQLGIDLTGGTQNAAGVTSNDTDDPDTGPNNLQNFPLLNSATRSNATNVTTVAGSLNSNPSTLFTIELFVVLAVDASGHGEGQVLLASQNVTTNAGGDVGFAFQFGNLAPGNVLTATATAATAGSTSEFAANRTVVPGP